MVRTASGIKGYKALSDQGWVEEEETGDINTAKRLAKDIRDDGRRARIVNMHGFYVIMTK